MRNDFRLMKAVGAYTRLGPRDRIQRLMDFNKRISTTRESLKVLDDFKMKLDNKLIEFNGRLVDPQKILLGNNDRYFIDDFMKIQNV